MRLAGICAIAVVLLSTSDCSSTSTGNVNGFVIDELGDSVDGVMVRVDGELARTAFGGRFSVRAAPIYTATTATFDGLRGGLGES